MEKTFTVKQAATKLGISVKNCYAKIYRKQLKAHRRGHRVLIKDKAIQEYLRLELHECSK